MLEVETDPLALWRYCRYFPILEMAILKEELICLDHFWCVFLWLALRIPEAGWFRWAVREIDSDKGLVVLWVEITWVFMNVVDGATLPCGEFLSLWIMSSFTL